MLQNGARMQANSALSIRPASGMLSTTHACPSSPLIACMVSAACLFACCSHAARFVAFVAGSVAALLLVMTLLDERLLERDLLGRQLVW